MTIVESREGGWETEGEGEGGMEGGRQGVRDGCRVEDRERGRESGWVGVSRERRRNQRGRRGAGDRSAKVMSAKALFF